MDEPTARDDRVLPAMRLQTFLIAVALLLVGALREAGGFDERSLLTWGYVCGLVGGAVALLALYRAMQRSASGAAS